MPDRVQYRGPDDRLRIIEINQCLGTEQPALLNRRPGTFFRHVIYHWILAYEFISLHVKTVSQVTWQ